MAAKKPRYAAVVTEAGFEVISPWTRQQLKEKGYKPGDDVSLEIYKVRNAEFNNLVHQFGVVLSENLDDFTGVDPHKVIKRIQLEGGIACDEMALRGDFGIVYHRIPQSIAFDQMEEGDFKALFREMTRYVAREYWPSLTPEQIEQMAGFMPDTP
jgi:hypothetical protein